MRTSIRQKIPKDIVHPKTKKVLVKEGEKYKKRVHAALEAAGITHIPIHWRDVLGRIVADDLVDASTGEVLAPTESADYARRFWRRFRRRRSRRFECLVLDAPDTSTTIRDTMMLDKIEPARKRSWRFTGRCGRAALRRWRWPTTSSTAFSSTSPPMTFPRSEG